MFFIPVQSAAVAQTHTSLWTRTKRHNQANSGVLSGWCVLGMEGSFRGAFIKVLLCFESSGSHWHFDRRESLWETLPSCGDLVSCCSRTGAAEHLYFTWVTWCPPVLLSSFGYLLCKTHLWFSLSCPRKESPQNQRREPRDWRRWSGRTSARSRVPVGSRTTNIIILQ